jgi:cytochrome c5
LKVNFNFTFAVAIGIALLSACGAGVARPDPNDARWASERWPGTTVADLSRGQDIFVARCSSCHALPPPGKKTPDEWAGVLDEMGAKAKLSATDQDLVLRYLSAASRREHTAEPHG